MSRVLQEYELTPYASHCSVFLSDREATSDVDPGAWHDNAVQLRRILVAEFQLQIATARHDVVPVHLRVFDSTPAADLVASHVVEADVRIPSGRLVIHSVDDVFADLPDVALKPGRYRVRVSYRLRDEPPLINDLAEPGDYYNYVIDLWLSDRPAEPQVLVQGPLVWAG